MSVELVIDECPWCDQVIVQGNNTMDPDGIRWHHECRREYNAQMRAKNELVDNAARDRIKAQRKAERQELQAKRGPGRPRKVDPQTEVEA